MFNYFQIMLIWHKHLSIAFVSHFTLNKYIIIILFNYLGIEYRVREINE